MGRNQYSFEKRQREIKKKKRKEAKRLKKVNGADPAEEQRLINEYLQQPIPEGLEEESAESADSSEPTQAEEEEEEEEEED